MCIMCENNNNNERKYVIIIIMKIIMKVMSYCVRKERKEKI